MLGQLHHWELAALAKARDLITFNLANILDSPAFKPKVVC